MFGKFEVKVKGEGEESASSSFEFEFERGIFSFRLRVYRDSSPPQF
jgi:hypothetical protein